MKINILKTNIKSFPLKIFIILLVILVLFLAVSMVKNARLLTGEKGFTQRVSSNETNNKKLEPPFDPYNKYVTNFYFSYSFFGELKEIKEVNGSKQIILKTEGESLPEFLIAEKDTKIYTVDKNKNLVPSKNLNINSGTKLSISVSYEPVKKEWLTRGIYIVE